MMAIRKFVDEYRAGVLIEQNGFDKEHWMDSKEAAKAFGMPRRRFLKYGLVNLFVHECNGDVYVFRKSAEKSLANGGGSGLFYIGDEAKKEEWLAYLEDKKRIKDGQLAHRGDKIDERCDDCGMNLEHCHEMIFNDRYVGQFSIANECDWCPYCSEYCHYDDDTVDLELEIEKARGEKVALKHPFEKKCWIPLNDALRKIMASRWRFFNGLHRDLFILKRNGKWMVLNKSVNKYLEEKKNGFLHPDGLFKLEEEK